MNFQMFVNYVDMPSCVVSVKKNIDGSCGEVRLVRANQKYKDLMGPKYYDNMPYDELVPREKKFEDFCYRAAIEKQRMHAYVDTKTLNVWTDMLMIPIKYDEVLEIGYCLFIFEFTKNPEADRMSNVSMETATLIIQSCVKLMNTDFKTGIGEVLNDVLNFAEADGCRIMLVDHENKDAVIFSESVREGAWPTRPKEGDVITYDIIKTWEDVIGQTNVLIIKDEKDMDDVAQKNPIWVAQMRENGVKNLALIPLARDLKAIGYLFVMNFNLDRLVQVKELIELLSFFIGAEIYNYILMRKLEKIGLIDSLTGLNNRYAMTQRVKEINKLEDTCSFAVVSADLNGLKQVNDNLGHDAGDRLLVNAAEMLLNTFDSKDIFRMGGDEFAIIISDISNSDFKKKIYDLKEKISNSEEVSFSIGDFWSDGSVDIVTAFRYADKAMYKDKDRYYKETGKERRKSNL